MISLYLIRHGMTKFNEEKRYCGWSDINLSELGIEQIKEKIKEVNYPKCSLYFTSNMKRSNTTLNLIYGEEEFKPLEALREYNFGEFEGKTYEELKEDKRYIDWILDNEGNVKCPKGESKIEFWNRVYGGFKELVESLENEAVVVCHGGVIGILLEKLSNLQEDFYSLQPSCGGGYKIKVSKDLKIEILERF